MAKVTVKVSFDDSDPLYRFLVRYGERFGHGGSSVTARLMLDQAFLSAPSLNPFEEGRVQSPTAVPQPLASTGEEEGRVIPKVGDDPGRQNLLSAIQDFQSQL